MTKPFALAAGAAVALALPGSAIAMSVGTLPPSCHVPNDPFGWLRRAP